MADGNSLDLFCNPTNKLNNFNLIVTLLSSAVRANFPKHEQMLARQ